MMAVTLEIHIDTSEIKGLEAQFRKAQDTATDKALNWLDEHLKHYPPVRPSSTYIRTGNLRNRVLKRKTSFSGGAVISQGRYAHWVRDSRRQARVHRGRWPTDRDIAKEAEQKVKGFYEGELEKVK